MNRTVLGLLFAVSSTAYLSSQMGSELLEFPRPTLRLRFVFGMSDMRFVNPGVCR